MRDFACPSCGQRLAFESSVGLSCSNGIGFDVDQLGFVVVERDGSVAGQPPRRMCGNLDTAGCSWVVSGGGTLCRSCALTRTRPADGDPEMSGFVAAERAKRRLVASPMSGPGGFTRLVELWVPLAWALNMVDRSMGHHDLYPFALPPRVLDKMSFVHRLVTQARGEVAAAS